MKNTEQKEMEVLQAIAKAVNEPVFSQEEYETFKQAGLSADEVKSLEKAEVMSNLIGTLPADEAGIQRLAAALGAISNENPEQNLANIKIIAERDPEMFTKLMSLTSIMENDMNGAE